MDGRKILGFVTLNFQFFCESLLQLVGLTILAIGVWAWIEKDTFSNISRLTNVALDPAFIFIIVGTSFTLIFYGVS
jgi:tetraspanin-5